MLHARDTLPQAEAVIEDGFLSAATSLWNPRPREREARIASAIVDAANAEALCLGGARLLRIGVNVGADCGIDIASLNGALRVICQGTDLEAVPIHLIECPRRNLCHHCRSEFVSSCVAADCPRCASPDIELISGDELELAFIEVERA